VRKAVARDEADYLSDGSLELVRRVINDEAQTGVVLAGLLRLKYKLRNLRNDHQQLTSRVGALLEVKRLAKPDAVKVIEGVWQGLAPAAMRVVSDPLSPHERAREGFTDAVWNMTGGGFSTDSVTVVDAHEITEG
jgi:hypothetical protein